MITFTDGDIENEREAQTYPLNEETVDRFMRTPLVVVDWGEAVKEDEA